MAGQEKRVSEMSELFGPSAEGVARAAAQGQMWGRLSGVLLPRLAGHGLIAYQRWRDESGTAWGPATLLYEEGFDPELLASYTSYYHRTNVWAANEAAMQPGVAVTSSMLYPDADLKRTEYYAHWLRPQDIFYAIGGVIQGDATSQVKLSVVRPEGAGAYGGGELAYMRSAMTSLRQAWRLQERAALFEAVAACGMRALDSLEVGIFLLAADGRLCFANATGTAQLDGRAPVRVRNDRLASDDPAVQEVLDQKTLPGAVRARAGAVTVTVLPAPPAMRERERVARVVMVSDRRGDVMRFARERGLTSAEREVLALLLEGCSVKEISRRRATAYTTVRSQVAGLLGKAGCGSQRELLARFAS